jgi:hypothetical protein
MDLTRSKEEGTMEEALAKVGLERRNLYVNTYKMTIY